MSVATMQRGETDKHVVAVIGDGAMSGGLAFEGLNNVSETPNNLLIILNDNDMSISNSVGGMKRYLLNLHTSSAYNRIAQPFGAPPRELGLVAALASQAAHPAQQRLQVVSSLTNKTFSRDSTSVISVPTTVTT